MKETEVMSHINCDSNELKILKREVEELQNNKKTTIVKSNKDFENEKKGNRKPGLDSATAEKNSEFGKSLHELTTYVEGFALEIEDFAKERPTLAILGAFALGIIVGHLFSRK
jgi:ElaB/YqjD/DUF883 family membrane-anchored ribosome-binding protein